MRQHHFFGALRIAFVAALLTASVAQAQTAAANYDAASADSTINKGVPQRDIFDVFRGWTHKNVEPEMSLGPPIGLQWALLPTISFNPVYGLALGVSLSGSGLRGEGSNRYSTVALSLNYSTTGQLQAMLRGDIFSPGGNYLLKTDLRYLDTERSTWGLGPITRQQEEYPMQFVLGRVYASVYRRMTGPLFFGFGFHYDEFMDIVDERAVEGEVTPFSTYSGGTPSTTTASGVSINVLVDTRDNLVNCRRGYFSSLVVRDYYEQMGSDAHWQELWVETRMYTPIPATSRDVLALWIYGWMTFGPAPYLNLPANGWDTYGRGARGYLAGRIRGVDQLYFEGEYRKVLTADGLWGMVAFVNATLTMEQGTGIYGNADPGGGLGLRIKFNKKSNTNLALDYGVGNDGQRGFFMGMTEVF